MREAEI